jgi:hypothetical protein
MGEEEGDDIFESTYCFYTSDRPEEPALLLDFIK